MRCDSVYSPTAAVWQSERLCVQTSDVLAFVEQMQREGRTFWVAGGWGVDALVGKQTRPHQDLDVAVDKRQFDAIVAQLGEQGYRITVDWFPVRIEMTSLEGLRVDLHPLKIAEDGSGRQAGLHGVWYDYPADQFTTGRIGGMTVPCIGRNLQIVFHQGYEPREIDLLDLAQLEQL